MINDKLFALPVTRDAEFEKFQSQQYPEIIFNMACLMDATAPKHCKCGSRMTVKELEYRFAINIDPFLCYSCLKKHEKAGAIILPSEQAGYPRKLSVNL